MKKIINNLGEMWSSFIEDWKVVMFFIFPVIFLLFYINLYYSNIGFLQLHSIDEYIFHGSLRGMYLGLINHKFSSLFGYGFYQYGFIYFFLNLVAVLPALILEKTTLVIIIPRLVTSFFAVGSLIVIYKIARLHLDKTLSLLFTLFFITLPAFWFNATWFHPDWMMTFFLLVSIFLLVKDNWSFDKYFYWSVFFYGLAVAFKYQAITFIPIIFFYIFYENIRGFNFWDLRKKVIMFVGSLVSIGGVFLVFNPYIIHPLGWMAFSSSFISNMKSNSTNHGVAHIVTLWDKVELAIGGYYINSLFLLILVAISSWLVVVFLREKKKNIFSVISINFLINLAYLLFFVNKAWQIYYLPVMICGLLSFVYIIFKNLKWGKIPYTISLAIFVQIVFYSGSYCQSLVMSRDAGNPDSNDYLASQNIEINNFVLENLKEVVSKNDIVLLSSYTPFDYEKVGLTYENIKIIYGPLSKESIDSKSYIKSQKAFWGDAKTEEEIALSFKKIDYIILRKNIPFIDTKRIEKSSDKESYLKAVEIIGGLNDGNLGYRILAEDEFVIIYKNNERD